MEEIDVKLAINKKLASDETMTGEDKRLGAWFILPDGGSTGAKTISKERFANKVLKYLWDDAFKLSRDKFFAKDDKVDTLKYKTLDAVIDAFIKGDFEGIIEKSVLDEMK